MSRDKKMTTVLLIIALVLVVAALAVWWRVFFGTANPPLPRAIVTVATSTASSTGTGGATAAVPVVDGENPPLAEEQLSIDGATFNVEIASTTLEQTRGLSFRPSLGANDGMLFLFGSPGTQTFWMKDMNFPLDMIWINGNAVAGFAQDVPAPAPGTPLWNLPVYSSPSDVDKVLEVNAGTVAKYNMQIGDAVNIGPIE